MSKANGVKAKPRRGKPDPASEIKTALRKELQHVYNLHMAVGKIKGIMEGAADEQDTAKLQHRLRSIVGHRKALATAVRELAESVQRLIVLESEVG